LKEDNPTQVECKLNFKTEEARQSFNKTISEIMDKFSGQIDLETNQLSGSEVMGKVVKEYKVEEPGLDLEQIDELYKQYIIEIKKIKITNKEFDDIISKLEDLVKLENDSKKIINILESIIDDRLLLERIEEEIEETED
jgi:hypothetical protein